MLKPFGTHIAIVSPQRDATRRDILAALEDNLKRIISGEYFIKNISSVFCLFSQGSIFNKATHITKPTQV